MVHKDDLIYIYVDFVAITSTVSPDDALALVIGMYSIFELCFNKNSRTVRLLYACLHSDKRFLSNSMRIFIKENDIDIYEEKAKQKLATSVQTQAISSRETIPQSDSLLDSDSNLNEPTRTHSYEDNEESDLHIPLTINK